MLFSFSARVFLFSIAFNFSFQLQYTLSGGQVMRTGDLISHQVHHEKQVGESTF